MEIKELIKNARTENGFTQEKAAEELCVSRQTISNWENGKSLPDILSILKMSDLYHISLDELLKGDKKMVEKIKKDAKYQNLQKMYMSYSVLIMLICLIMEIVNIIRQLSTQSISVQYYTDEMMLVPFVVLAVGCITNVFLYKLADKTKVKVWAIIPNVIVVFMVIYLLFDTLINGVALYQEKGAAIMVIYMLAGITVASILSIIVIKLSDKYYNKKKLDFVSEKE